MRQILLATSFLIFFSSGAYATSLHVGTGGWLGEYQLGVEKWNFALIYGYTDDGHVHQFTLKYDYPVFTYATVGAFATYTSKKEYFIQNPSRYPSKNYYSENAVRFGLSFGLKYKIFYINANILDSAMEIIWNESKYRSGFNWTDRKLWSTGFGLRWEF